MKFPTLHLNGSGYAVLADDLGAALAALRNAQHAVANCTPHDRDYYMDGPNAGAEARAEHSARQQKLQEVADELATILDNIGEQHFARERYRRRWADKTRARDT